MTCVQPLAGPPNVRAEATAELVSDFVLLCCGGVPTPVGQIVPKPTFDLYVDTSVTSRLLTSLCDAGGRLRGRWLYSSPDRHRTGTDRIYVTLYGTGIRGRSKLDAASLTIGGIPAEVLYASPQQQAGVDQINIAVPRGVAGRGVVDVVLTLDGEAANVVTLGVR